VKQWTYRTARFHISNKRSDIKQPRRLSSYVDSSEDSSIPNPG